jgi:hypothetical protein
MRLRSRPIDAHAVLGIKPGASRAEIRRAYRRLALTIHPDVAGAQATGDMARLNEARDQLDAHAPAGGRPEGAPGSAESPGEPVEPRRPPAWAPDHEPAWTDHWSAWNELPRRD